MGTRRDRNQDRGGAETAYATASFTNTGKQAVTILDMRPSCGCTTATLEKNTYRPGESGQIRIALTLKGLSGSQQKTIEVLTDDSPDKPTVLTVHTTLPEFIVLSPRLLIWTVGEADKPKRPSLPQVRMLGNAGLGDSKRRGLFHGDAAQRRNRQAPDRKAPYHGGSIQEVIFIDAQTLADLCEQPRSWSGCGDAGSDCWPDLKKRAATIAGQAKGVEFVGCEKNSEFAAKAEKMGQ